MEEHKGDSPKNARIKINYEGKKPTVRFSYPCKKYQQGGTMVFHIFLGWFLLLGITYGISSSLVEEAELKYEKELYNECLLNYNLTLRFGCYDKYIRQEEARLVRKETLYPIIFLFSLTAILTLITYLPFKKFWSNVYPKINALLAMKKIKKFIPEEVKHTKELGYFCEIPIFSNIILDFKATKDFSKYLREFEIEEHKFKYFLNRRKKRKKKRKTPPISFNEQLWYARFYFTQQPKTGKLEVLFK